jgi:hypothetical protein
MTRPKTIKRPAKRNVRMARYASAREAIGTIEKGWDVYVLSFGQFSLLDAIGAILDQTGPADVSVATWTASAPHVEELAYTLNAMPGVHSFRLIVDRSLKERNSETYDRMIAVFGLDAIRTVYKTHAKFALIRNERFDVVVRTSMNLNHNARLEDLEVSEDRAFAEFFQRLIDGIFRENPPGLCACSPSVFQSVSDDFGAFPSMSANPIPQESLHEVRTTHIITSAD